jgi:hypothetical protein
VDLVPRIRSNGFTSMIGHASDLMELPTRSGGRSSVLRCVTGPE